MPAGVTVPAGDLAPGVDLRTGRQIVALPPGQGREWELSPAEVELAELPDWVIALANGRRRTGERERRRARDRERAARAACLTAGVTTS